MCGSASNCRKIWPESRSSIPTRVSCTPSRIAASLVLPMAQLDRAPRVTASQEDVVFRGNFCNGGAITQTIDVTDPSGNAVPFQICLAGSTRPPPGITITPSSGVTPARVKISIDPTTIRSLIGTKAYQFEIFSGSAVNMPRPPSRGRSGDKLHDQRSQPLPRAGQ